MKQIVLALALIGAFTLIDKATDWLIPSHEEASYSRHDVSLVNALVKAGTLKKVSLIHPRNAKERAKVIARIWGLEDGNFEIGSLK
jgi:hypothetical protein